MITWTGMFSIAVEPWGRSRPPYSQTLKFNTMKNNTYNVKAIEYETCCSCIDISTWKELMKGAVKANKREINRLVKRFEPTFYNMLALNFYNPYGYFRTKHHFVVVHSAIEYFFKIIES